MPKDLWEKYVHHNAIDTLKILTFLIDIDFLPATLGKLDSLVQYFNIPMGQTHHAREDIRMTVEVYKNLIGLLKSKKLESMGNMGSNSLLEIIER
jgi:DNA polymerase III epsilon subunit-like protein